jgi:hypothetical protein
MNFILVLVIAVWQCSPKQSSDKFPWITIPEGATAVNSYEESFPNGDGYRMVIYSLDMDAMKNIEDQLNGLHSNPLPITNEVIDDVVYKHLRDTDHGSYKIEHNKNDVRDIYLVILNKTQNSLLLLVSFQ